MSLPSSIRWWHSPAAVTPLLLLFESFLGCYFRVVGWGSVLKAYRELWRLIGAVWKPSQSCEMKTKANIIGAPNSVIRCWFVSDQGINLFPLPKELRGVLSCWNQSDDSPRRFLLQGTLSCPAGCCWGCSWWDVTGEEWVLSRLMKTHCFAQKAA